MVRNLWWWGIIVAVLWGVLEWIAKWWGDESVNGHERLASVAIMGGVILGVGKYIQHLKNQRRRRGLISFPDNWRMERNLRQGVYKFQLRARVLASCTAVRCVPKIRVGKQRIRLNQVTVDQTSGRDPQWITEVQADLDSIANDVDEIEAELIFTILDDGTKRRSGWRTCPIIVWPPPEIATVVTDPIPKLPNLDMEGSPSPEAE